MATKLGRNNPLTEVLYVGGVKDQTGVILGQPGVKLLKNCPMATRFGRKNP